MKQLVTQQDLGLSQRTASGRFFARLMMKALGINKLNRLYGSLSQINMPEMAQEMLEKQGLSVEIVEGLCNVPQNSGALVAANIPHGLLDILALAATVIKQKKNVKFLINSRLADLAEFRQYVVGDDSEPRLVVAREVVEFLASGGVVIAFPANRVSGYTKMFVEIADHEWNPSVFKLAELANVPIVPLFIEGWNSRKYLLAAKVNGLMSDLLLVREFLRTRDQKVRIMLGRPVSYLQVGKDKREVANFVRAALYLLAARLENIDEMNESEVVADKHREPLSVIGGVSDISVRAREEAVELAEKEGQFIMEKDGYRTFMVSSKKLREVGYYQKVEPQGYVGRFRNELFVKSGDRLVLSASLIFSHGESGELAHGRFDSHRYFEFSNKKIDRLVQSSVEVSNIYSVGPDISDEFMGDVLLSVCEALDVRYMMSTLLMGSGYGSLGFSIMVRYLRGRMGGMRSLARLIIPRVGRERLRSGRFVSGQVRGVRRVELLTMLIREAEGGNFSLPGIIEWMLDNGAHVASLGVSHGDTAKCNALLVWDVQTKK